MPDRLFLVTFDIPGARPGDVRYRLVDQYLGAIGRMYKPLKQVRFLVTNGSPRTIVNTIKGQIGLRGNAAVIRVARYSRIDFHDPVIERKVQRLIRRYGRL